MSSYLQDLQSKSMEDLLIGGPCYLEGSEKSVALQATMPELTKLVHQFYDLKGVELLAYDPPQWLESYLLEVRGANQIIDRVEETK